MKFLQLILYLILVNISSQSFAININPNLVAIPDSKKPIAIKNQSKIKKKKEDDYSYIKKPGYSKYNQAIKYMNQGKIAAAEAIIKPLFASNPENVNYRIAMANLYLERLKDIDALITIQDGLALTANNVDLLVKEGQIQQILRNYDLAQESYRKALLWDPNNDKATTNREKINEISPQFLYGRNEIGVYTNNYYVNDLHSIWNYSTAYYSRNTNYGKLTGRVNYASRQGITANQYAVDFAPKINRNLYFELTAAVSDSPELFPTNLWIAEGYASLSKKLQISGGAAHAKINNTYLNTYTGSLNYYVDTYWIMFRPYYFIPRNSSLQSILYTARFRKTLSTIDNYVELSLGAGKSPDLADLLTVNFFDIKNDFANINYSFPLFNYHLIVNVGGGYTRWVYPSGFVRNFYNGSIGFSHRF